MTGAVHACMQDEERLWTELIDKYEGVDAPWRGDIVGRAYGNRGNARTRQGKMDAALVDYNRAIDTCPWSVDPVLNRRGSLLQPAMAPEAHPAQCMSSLPATCPCMRSVVPLQ